MSLDDIEYYRARATQERIAAADATQTEVAAIHAELARLYEALVARPELGLGRGMRASVQPSAAAAFSRVRSSSPSSNPSQ